MVWTEGVGFIYIRYFDIFSQIHARRPSAGLGGLDLSPRLGWGWCPVFLMKRIRGRSSTGLSVTAPSWLPCLYGAMYTSHTTRAVALHTPETLLVHEVTNSRFLLALLVPRPISIYVL